ncbi:antibiotic biosynthesis monooxygenase family protein [Pararhizobium sp. O133]|uniref:antibiotic biosynthesis monooxygenase family protein n=1 Tax=Pararhizobium sp. O133 TaxID=3449278 RepID=UPI003F689642
MIAVIFEVTPAYGRRSAYLDLAGQLHARLDKIDGFLSIERFESLKLPGKILSLSFWRDEAAITRWRNGPDHRAAQHAGRNGTFADYRLRIAGVIRDYGMAEREQAPEDSRVFHAEKEGHLV